MSENNPTRNCPRCGGPLAADAPEGLCPRCLMALHLGAPTEEFGPGGTRIVPPRMEVPSIAELARLFPQFEILEFIGRGGMGFVYKARQPKLDRLVALKILAPNSGAGAHFPERFQREAQALAKLNHPNIVAVYDFGEAGGFYFLAMEFVEGANLRTLLQAQKFTPEQALNIVPPICEALQYAHGQGIVHRDIKPENILVDKQGRVKIADFGIAKILGTEGQATLTGEQVIGTPHYMAPEQVERPATVDHRADIYSLGVVFYEMLTGELPLGNFQRPSAKVQIDVRLDEVVLRALEKEPVRRYQQAGDVKTRLETIAQTPGAPGAASAGVDAAFTEAVLARETQLNIGWCLSRGWNLVKHNIWPLLGVYALILALKGIAASPSAGSNHGHYQTYFGGILSLVLSGPLSGGLFLYYLKTIRGERRNVETAFAGFSKLFLPLFLGDFVASVLIVFGLMFFLAPGIYLLVAWKFTLALIVDRGMDFWSALELSRKVITRHWWKFFGFALVLLILKLAGIVFCLAGFLITAPVAIAALMYAYEDIFGLTPQASSPPLAAKQAPFSGEKAIIAVVAGILGVIVLVAVIGLLAAIAIPNFVRGREAGKHFRSEKLAQDGWLSWNNGDWSTAREDFGRAVTSDPKNANAWNGRGWAWFNGGNPQAAETNFEKAVALDANLAGALNGLGQVYLSERKYDDAEKFLLQAAPNAPAAWFGLTRLYLLEGKFDEARTWAQKIVDSGQADDTARQMLKAAEDKQLSDGLRAILEPR